MTSLLQQWATAQAERRPESTALVFGGERLTYGRLEQLANRLARMLKKQGCRRNEPICLLLPKCPAALIGILGILKADCTYVPLDPGSPAARVSKILDTLQSRWILAAGPVRPLLDELLAKPPLRERATIGWLEDSAIGGENFQPRFSLADLESQDAGPLTYWNTRAEAAYIMFTSGSTGAPKGVIITHSNVIHFIDWAVRYFQMDPSDRVSAHSPLHFDLSVFDIFGAFAAGAELHLVQPELNVLPNKLADFIRGSQLTQWFSVPSVLSYMAKFDVVRPRDFPALKRLLWCGEVFPTPALIYWMKRLPHVTFTNLYGPTETTIASSYHTVAVCPADEKAPIPIGRACDGEQLLVLDDALRPVQPGETGHLYIRGAGLSPGYYKDPQKTREAFVRNLSGPDPADRLYRTGDLAKIGPEGLVYFQGRSDSQIKSRGHRIELGEIAVALNALTSLRESSVVALPTSGFEGAAICCAYVPLPGTSVTPATIRAELNKVLPSYMVPARWMRLDELPKNANGKTDNRRIKERFQAEDGAAPPAEAQAAPAPGRIGAVPPAA